MPMVEVAVTMRVACPYRTPTAPLPVTRRKAVTSPDLAGGCSITMRLPAAQLETPPRDGKNDLAVGSGLDGVARSDAGLQRRGLALTLTVPETR